MDTTPRPAAERRSSAVLSFLAAGDLTTFAWLAVDAARAPGLGAREALSRTAAEQMGHYDAVLAELAGVGGSREDVAPHLVLLEEVGTRTEPGSWEERVLRTGLMGAMVYDLGEVLARLLPADLQERALAGRRAPDELAVELVGQQLAEDEPLRARLSLWGRRIAGEVLGVLPPVIALLVAASDGDEEAAALAAPAMSEMSGRHARRMGRLGLTA
ncbi:ferritin-like fold-containing protein [Georgenia satyanarayanai]|uniref:ferritin-like fold-containing protein n=1 Tax=Georgenia satyanarayanai TaxID=860221 RepID=UPI00186B35FD|nr:ferritin-like fold-containing protein [Georgenia satyanarayanai]